MRTRDTTFLQPPRSIQVGYGTHAEAYAALDRARATRTTGPSQPALPSHQDVPSTDPGSPIRDVPRGLPHLSHRSRSVQTAQQPRALPLSRPHTNAPHRSYRSRGVQTAQPLPLPHLHTNTLHTNTNALLSHSHAPPATEDPPTPLGSSATPPMALRLVHPPFPPSSRASGNARIYSYTPPATEALRTPLGSSATPPMAPRLRHPPLPPSSSTSSNGRISEFGIGDEAVYRVVLRHGPSLDVYVYYER